MIKMSNELVSLETDVIAQQGFVLVLIEMFKGIIQDKTKEEISELEMGFRLGEIYRMLHEFHADAKKLGVEVKLLIETLKEENGKHILLD